MEEKLFIMGINYSERNLMYLSDNKLQEMVEASLLSDSPKDYMYSCLRNAKIDQHRKVESGVRIAEANVLTLRKQLEKAEDELKRAKYKVELLQHCIKDKVSSVREVFLSDVLDIKFRERYLTKDNKFRNKMYQKLRRQRVRMSRKL